jgi:hypothetical protein
MTGGAEIARGGGTHAVLARKVGTVNDVRLGKDMLRRKIDVAPVARAHGKLILVLVATEAETHCREQ